ncbi:flagellar hook-basal body complex protein [Maricaulis sp. D1M11]|uniref:flagellar hook-basal body complex protein n=1 Tax=Maricaulis sp. D1M11 TaxID=3076117 RepID=UPI0039B44E48
MIGAMFIGLSGMQAYSNGLRQISNNITNLNTPGFKATDLTFQGMFGDSGQSSGLGYGVTLADSRLSMKQGEVRLSDNPLDLAVDGEGFLVLLGDDEILYTRTGSFEVGPDGDIILSGTQYKLAVLDDTGQATPVNIESHRISQPQATQSITFSDNLSSTATEHTVAAIDVFNALGEQDSWDIRFEKDTSVTNQNSWTVIVENSAGVEIARETLSFIAGVVDPLTSSFTVEDVDGGYSIELDFSSGVTSFSSGSVSTLRLDDSDGYGIGEITSLTANENGEFELTYSNGQDQTLGAIALATLRDLSSITQTGRGLFRYDANKRVDLSPSSRETVGTVVGSAAEASNVDLSSEFGDLILIQRGYQASSQVVSVSNDMIQQLFGLRGR